MSRRARHPVNGQGLTVPRPAHYFTLRDRCVSLARLRPGQQGDDYDFTSDRYSDYLRRRRDLLLGHREVCPRWTTCKSSQAARGADLSRGYPSAGSAIGGNWWTVAGKSIVDIAVALLSEHHLSSQPFPAGIAAGRNFDGAVGRRQASARIGVARGCRTASIARIGSPPAMTDRRVRRLSPAAPLALLAWPVVNH